MVKTSEMLIQQFKLELAKYINLLGGPYIPALEHLAFKSYKYEPVMMASTLLTYKIMRS